MALNPQNLQVGRHQKNKRNQVYDIIGDANFISLIEMHLDIALRSTSDEISIGARQFLLDKIVRKLRPEPSYVKLDLIPVTCIDDIKTNEKIIMESVASGTTSLEDGEKLLAMTEQARKTYEATEVIKLIEDIDTRLKDNGM